MEGKQIMLLKPDLTSDSLMRARPFSLSPPSRGGAECRAMPFMASVSGLLGCVRRISSAVLNAFAHACFS